MKVQVKDVITRKGGYRFARLLVKESEFPFEISRIEVEFAPSKEAEVLFTPGKILDIKLETPQ